MSEASLRARSIRRLHRLSVAAGLVMIALVLVATVTSPKPCGNLSNRYPPIVAFELARSGDDLRAVFGDGRQRAAECRKKVVAAMDTINHVDFALFMPAYGVFLGAAFLGLRRRRRSAAAVGVALVGVALAADVVENVCLLGLTPSLDPASTWLAVLPWAAGLKWLALGGVGVVAGLVMWRGESRHRVSVALCMLTPLATIAALADPHRFGPLVTTGVAASWAVLLIDGLVQSRARIET